MTKFHLTQFDLFFLSYDEPNAEENWADLLDKAPWAKRVHGVKGFDAAHRECARQSETPWFITVDADNKVFSEFFDLSIELNEATDLGKSFTWNAENAINGLMYGNGGVKLWSKKFAEQMSCHEFSESGKSVDFCWTADYHGLGKTYSSVHNNHTPYQAYRVGFREGVKLALDRGNKVNPQNLKKEIHPINYRNLLIWSTVGADVKNGKWAILGARHGLLTHLQDFKIENINDYAWFDSHWADNKFSDYTETDLNAAIVDAGEKIKPGFKLNLPALDNASSAFFREMMVMRNV